MRIEESLRRGLGCGQDKIFVIGFNKNAGTTIAHLCMKNLLEAHHQPNWGFSAGLGKYQRGNFWNKFKCFSDGGNKEDFKFLSAHYPDSLFILNCRPIKDWLFSRFKHGFSEHSKGQETPLWPCTSDTLAAWIKANQKHHINVVKYFSRKPEQLIITDISQPDWLPFLCEFSGLDFYDLHSNKRSSTVLSENDIKEFNTSLLEACDLLGITVNDLEASLFLESSLNTNLSKSLQLIKNNLTFMIK